MATSFVLVLGGCAASASDPALSHPSRVFLLNSVSSRHALQGGSAPQGLYVWIDINDSRARLSSPTRVPADQPIQLTIDVGNGFRKPVFVEQSEDGYGAINAVKLTRADAQYPAFLESKMASSLRTFTHLQGVDVTRTNPPVFRGDQIARHRLQLPAPSLDAEKEMVSAMLSVTFSVYYLFGADGPAGYRDFNLDLPITIMPTSIAEPSPEDSRPAEEAASTLD